MKQLNLIRNLFSVAVMITLACNVSAQVSIRDRIQIMDRDIFNYPESTDAPVKTKKSKTNRIVYSDRTGNQSYEDPYFQRKRSSHGIGTPYYIVGEKNGTYKLVQADPDITGKPKSIIGFLYNSKRHFKEPRKVNYAGWIPSENVLMYDHARINPRNNQPIRYRIGINSINKLFDIHQFFNGDTLKIYGEPFLKTTTDAVVVSGEVVYLYAEYNNSENKEVICNWSRDCRISLLQDNNEDKQRIQHLREKYHSLNKELIYNVLNPEYVTAIIQYIITGAPLVEFIVTEIRDKQKGLKPWEMLSGFFDMEQQKLESICQDTITSILDREIKDAYQLGYSIAYLSYFHAIGIFYFIQAYVSLIKVRIAEMIDIQTSLEELYQLRGLFISGCNYVTTDSKTSITDDIVDYFLQKMKSKINELPDQMQKALRNLTEGTVEQLIIIDRLPYPDKSCTYELRAIFASEDANALFDAICKLSNKSKNTFTQFLAYHYNFDYDLQDVGDRYKADVPCLLKLKDLVGNEISISKGVDKLAFIRLKDALLEAIRRCEGKSDTLPPM